MASKNRVDFETFVERYPRGAFLAAGTAVAIGMYLIVLALSVFAVVGP